MNEATQFLAAIAIAIAVAAIAFGVSIELTVPTTSFVEGFK